MKKWSQLLLALNVLQNSRALVYANLLVPPGKPFPQARHLPPGKTTSKLNPSY